MLLYSKNTATLLVLINDSINTMLLYSITAVINAAALYN